MHCKRRTSQQDHHRKWAERTVAIRSHRGRHHVSKETTSVAGRLQLPFGSLWLKSSLFRLWRSDIKSGKYSKCLHQWDHPIRQEQVSWIHQLTTRESPMTSASHMDIPNSKNVKLNHPIVGAPRGPMEAPVSASYAMFKSKKQYRVIIVIVTKIHPKAM